MYRVIWWLTCFDASEAAALDLPDECRKELPCVVYPYVTLPLTFNLSLEHAIWRSFEGWERSRERIFVLMIWRFIIRNAGDTPVEEWGLFRFFIKKKNSSERQFFPSTAAIRMVFCRVLLNRSTRVLAVGQRAVILRCLIPNFLHHAINSSDPKGTLSDVITSGIPCLANIC